MTRKYWKSLDELNETPVFLNAKDQEFPMQQSVEEFLADEKLGESSTGRRDFLKFLGFSVAAATVAACEAPVTKAVPYVNKPEDVTPGMPTWYASTYYDGATYASILVKTREGRPIFIKGNKDYGITKGGVNPQVIASVLGLYDGERLKNPTIGGVEKTWSNVDEDIMKAAKAAGKVVLVSSTITSPSLLGAIGEFGMSLGEGRFEHVQYDAVSYAAMREANKTSLGLTTMTMEGTPSQDGIIPDYDFSKAKTIVALGADFLNSWLLPTQFAGQYGSRRNPDGDWMSKHFQFESMMSITGSNADSRAMIKPSEQGKVLAYILKSFGVSTDVAANLEGEVKKVADEAIKALKASKNESLVIADSNNVAVQTMVNKLNTVLGAYTTTININNEINLFKSEDMKMNKLVADVIAGKGPDMILFYGTNPVYTLPNGAKFGEALAKVKTTVSFAGHADETASRCKMVAPDLHALEGWMDHNPTRSHYAIAQPTIRPLNKNGNASAIESFLVWAGKEKRGGQDSRVAYDYIKGNWITYGFPEQTKYTDAETYWNMNVHNSCESDNVAVATAPSFNDGALGGLAAKLPKTEALEVVMYQKAGLGTGMQAGNPWLQELPDPMTKVTWDNYITMNPIEMAEQGYVTTFDQEHGLNMATIKVGDVSVTLPVYPLPGQAPKTIGIALGYGRGANGEKIGKAAFQTKEYGGHATDENGNPKPIGANAFALTSTHNGTFRYDAGASMSKAEGMYAIGATQIHSTVMGRHSIVRETTLGIFKGQDKEAYNPTHMLQKMDKDGNHVSAPVGEFDLWEAHPVEKIGHRWGMTIDLSSCIGCGSCLVACQSENNVPVVGKDEVRRGREMHWLRLDRYFSSPEEVTVGQRKDDKAYDYHEMEKAELNPKVVHQPMMCHHCNHAPCETVCPVAATTHSNEGLNQMVYNRCIGTRYCANNCPYKVRRFNWFNYPSYKAQREINPAQDDLGRMVLNPDVTVRTRGVMEKCSMCVQRIQAGKLTAKMEERPVKDGDYSTACSDVCPTNAITVGDWNDLQSMLRESADDKRSYQALEEVGVKPNVWYKVKVRNEENEALAHMQMSGAHHEEAHAEGHGENKNHH